MDRDQGLLAAVARGEEAALEELMKAHMPSVHAIARRLLKDDAAADDAAQETFLSVWKNAASYRGDASPRAWIMSIALNKARSAWRWRSLRSWLSLDAPAGDDEAGATLADALAGPDADPADVSAKDDRAQRLRAAVDKLPQRQREIILLRLEGLEINEIVSAAGVAEGTVKATLHQARANLEKLLAEEAA